RRRERIPLLLRPGGSRRRSPFPLLAGDSADGLWLLDRSSDRVAGPFQGLAPVDRAEFDPAGRPCYGAAVRSRLVFGSGWAANGIAEPPWLPPYFLLGHILLTATLVWRAKGARRFMLAISAMHFGYSLCTVIVCSGFWL